MTTIDLSVNIGKLFLKNPILLASGTVGYGEEISKFIDLNLLGGIITKSISLKPRKGNKPPRVVETSAGMLNSIGLANVGLDEFIKNKLPFLEKFNIPVICNIAASSYDEYLQCVRTLDSFDSINAFEINLSCPNVKEGGLQFGNNLTAVAKITDLVRNATDKTIIIKLSPNVSYISEFAKVCKENGADAVSAINTLVGAAFNIFNRKPKLSTILGGLSGPAIKPVAVAKIFEIHKNVDIPIIGIGGITNWQDVIEFIIAGASAVQLGTLNFIDPTASISILEALNNYCLENNIDSINQLKGAYLIE